MMSYQPLRRTDLTTSAASPARASLLRQLSISFLPTSPITAQFYAERLHALDTAAEPAVYLLALTLALNHRDQEAIWLLRQGVSYQPTLNSSEQDNPFHSKRYPSNLKTTKPAIECSLRCARLHSQSCLTLGRHKEGRDALTRLQQSNQPLIQPDCSIPTTFANFGGEVEGYVVELEIGRLARKAGEHERAVLSWRKVLEQNVWCWEALEGLCAAGYPPDIDTLLPIKPKVQPLQTGVVPPPPERRLMSPQPAPLGPSQTSNSVAAGRMGQHPPAHAAPEGLGFLTPSDTASPAPLALGNPKTRGEKSGLFGFGGGLWKKTNGATNGATNARPTYNPDESLDDNSSFEASMYQPTTLSFGAALQQANPASSSSLFTPPALAPAPHLIGKRQRGQGAAPITAAVPVVTPIEEEPRNARRPVRGVAAAPSGPATRREPPAPVPVAMPTRRSSRLSREPGSNSSILGASNSANLGPASVGMAKTRSSQSQNGSMALRGAAATKKRTKGGAGLSVLSDAERETSVSLEASPAPSSPSAASATLPAAAAVIDPAVEEAEEYVAKTVRAFAQAEVFGSAFECGRAIEALCRLPLEQQKSWRCLIGQAKCQLELLEYDKAHKAFALARQAAPHLLEAMELFSTLLWHQRNPTALSYLAQDLMSFAPRSPVAWIAAGNVFSHLEDHAGALRCFRRAAQLDEGCVYAYTLSGHECVTLEEWDRASHFFREAVRRDPRHYNAWFGLGNVFLQTGKLRLAEYHFRKAAALNPANASLAACVGQVLEKLGHRHDALAAYERAVRLAPRSAAVLFRRAKVLLGLRQFAAAEADLVRIRERAPNEFNVHFLLGKLYKVVGNQREMLLSFGCAQDIEPRMASLIREAVSEGVGGMEVDESREGV